MNVIEGDVWDWIDSGIIVIPTNIGWNKEGLAVMGAGLAVQAVERFPELPHWYGRECMAHGGNLPPLPWPNPENCRLILFPTKGLAFQPHLSWKADSSIPLIERGLLSLAIMGEALPGQKKIIVPMLGTGCGKLDENKVRLLMDEHLEGDRYIFVRRKPK